MGEYSTTKLASPSSSSLPLDSVLHRSTQLCLLLISLLLVDLLSINRSLAWPECSIRFKVRYPLCKLANSNLNTHLLLQGQIHPPLLLQNLTVLIEFFESLPQLVTDQEVLVVHHCPVLIAKVSFIVMQPSSFPQDRKDHPQLLIRQP